MSGAIHLLPLTPSWCEHGKIYPCAVLVRVQICCCSIYVVYMFSGTQVNKILIINKHSRYLSAVYFKKILDMVWGTTLVGRWETNKIAISEDGRI
jgi:hypothetical protein